MKLKSRTGGSKWTIGHSVVENYSTMVLKGGKTFPEEYFEYRYTLYIIGVSFEIRLMSGSSLSDLSAFPTIHPQLYLVFSSFIGLLR